MGTTILFYIRLCIGLPSQAITYEANYYYHPAKLADGSLHVN